MDARNLRKHVNLVTNGLFYLPAGLNVELAQIISYMKFETADDFNKLTRRLRAVPAQIEGVVEIMREGIRSELTLHSISLVRA